jgi:putative transposase
VADGFDPRLPSSAEELYILLGRTETRVLDRNGIVFEHLRYNSNSAELRRLRQRLEGSGKVKLKYHAGDLSRMYIYDPFERRYITVPSLDQSWTQNLSLWKHRLILRTLHREGKHVNREALAQARRKIREIFESGIERQRYGRWKTKVGSSQPVSQKSETVADEMANPAPAEVPDSHWQAALEANRQRAEAWAHQQHLIKETDPEETHDQS